MSRLAERPTSALTVSAQEVDEITMYAIDADGAPIIAGDIQRRTLAETLEVWRRAVADAHVNARSGSVGAMPASVDLPTMVGFREDVQMTLHADPRAVCAAAVEGELLARDFARMSVDVASMRSQRTELSWDVIVRTSRWRRRRATLRLAPSPSCQLTLLRLAPIKRQRIATTAFVAAGLVAAYELIGRVENALSDTVPPQGLEP